MRFSIAIAIVMLAGPGAASTAAVAGEAAGQAATPARKGYLLVAPSFRTRMPSSLTAAPWWRSPRSSAADS